jgi:hypothetical protein
VSPVRRILWTLVAATGTMFVLAYVCAMTLRVLDYDEVAHAHAVWLTELGDVPLRDFFENHAPLPWIILSPVSNAGIDGSALALRLRVSSAFGHILTLFLLVAHMRIGRRTIDPLWVAVAMLVMLTHESNIDYFIEGRPDVWATVLLLAGMLAARVERLTPSLRYGAFGFLTMASLLWAPKLIGLAGAFAVIELVRLRRAALRPAMAMGIGAAVAAGGVVLLLRASGIDVFSAYQLMLDYNTALATRGGYHYGLLRTLVDQRAITLQAAAGFACWLFAVTRRELRPNAFELAMAIFLLTQLALVPFPYKQYFAPWLLFAAVFIPFCSLLIDRVPTVRAVALPAVVLFLCVKSAFVWQVSGTMHGFSRTGAHWDLMRAHAGSDRHIVAPMTLHPITARNSMYATVGTTGANEGYGPETILHELKHPAHSPRFLYSSYRQELEDNHPDVIVFGSGAQSLFPIQERATRAFLDDHADEYRSQIAGRVEVFVQSQEAASPTRMTPPSTISP